MIVQSLSDDQGDSLQIFKSSSRSPGKNGKDMALCIGFFDRSLFWNSGWNHVHHSISEKVKQFLTRVG